MYGKMMIEELKRFFNTDELKPSIVVLDVGVFFPYANQDILKFDMGLNELPLDAGRFDDMKFNHRYPNRNYVTLSCNQSCGLSYYRRSCGNDWREVSVYGLWHWGF